MLRYGSPLATFARSEVIHLPRSDAARLFHTSSRIGLVTAFNDPRRCAPGPGPCLCFRKISRALVIWLFWSVFFSLKSFLSFSLVRFYLSRDGPDEAGEFARQRGDDHRRTSVLLDGAIEMAMDSWWTSSPIKRITLMCLLSFLCFV